MKLDQRHFYFDSLVGEYESRLSWYDHRQRVELIFDRLLAGFRFAGVETLEVGCGTGLFSKELTERGAKLVSLDIGRNLVKRASQRADSLGVAANACELPFAHDSFDLVLSSECVEHTPDPFCAIREMCRVCRPGGTVCITTPNRLWYPLLLVAQKSGLRQFEGVENWIFAGQAVEQMKKAGMKNIVLDGCHLLPFQIRPVRPLLRLADRWGSRLHRLMINFGVRAVKPPGPAA